MNARCCARCKTPYNCGNPACPCHKTAYDTAVWAAALAEGSPQARDTRFRLDEARGHRDPNGQDAGLSRFTIRGRRE